MKIWDEFEKFGTLRNVWVARNPPGFAFVEFKDHNDAADAVENLDQKIICKRRVRVQLSSGESRKGGGSRSRGQLCYECGRPGHLARECKGRRGRGRYPGKRYSRLVKASIQLWYFNLICISSSRVNLSFFLPPWISLYKLQSSRKDTSIGWSRHGHGHMSARGHHLVPGPGLLLHVVAAVDPDPVRPTKVPAEVTTRTSSIVVGFFFTNFLTGENITEWLLWTFS
ncbi:Serine/arginine-rich splicing factor 7 [Apostichopus japonicus]|uniref:Serine/arginine-rich splicing factor 7 n=1 Tax=Stichopus japonicus TaxID=307972 RepID=A0A2G8K6I3_STIJA|nr:Serine/arginine-rich splicing factor 7 [Apostichopus japonicus]